MERETGIEPATNSLEGCDSTIELLPHYSMTRTKALFILAMTLRAAAILAGRLLGGDTGADCSESGAGSAEGPLRLMRLGVLDEIGNVYCESTPFVFPQMRCMSRAIPAVGIGTKADLKHVGFEA
jgi:hypothetical protein